METLGKVPWEEVTLEQLLDSLDWVCAGLPEFTVQLLLLGLPQGA